MALNYLAPAPYALFFTRNGAFQADGNALISNVNTGLQTLDLLESGCVPLAFNPFANFRNLVDGGDFSINPFQRNIPGLASGGVIATPVAATPTYFADRFFAAGGASSAILMAATPDASVTGFNQSLKVSRQSGNSNTAVINLGQVVETFDSLRCQGQTVTLSFWARAGATFSGGALTVQLIAGNGVNQSAASLIARTWTGLSSVVSAQQGLTSAMTRYQFTGAVPASASQLGVLLSFTPSGTAGVDDSISINGVQLEIGPSASPFEHIDAQVTLEICQRYAWAIPEPGAGVGERTEFDAQCYLYWTNQTEIEKSEYATTLVSKDIEIALSPGDMFRSGSHQIDVHDGKLVLYQSPCFQTHGDAADLGRLAAIHPVPDRASGSGRRL